MRTQESAASSDASSITKAQLVRQAKSLLRRGRPEQAAHRLKDLVVRFPDSPDLCITYAMALRACGEPFAAEEQCRKVLSQKPMNRRALLERINATLSSGDLDAALDHCRQAERFLGGDISLALKTAATLQRMGRAGESVVLLSNLLKQHPEDIPVAMALGRAQFATGTFEEADVTYRAVLDTDPNHSGALLGRTQIALACGNQRHALQILERGSSTHPITPEFPDSACVVKYVELAIDSGDRERFESALPIVDTWLSKMNGQQLVRLAKVAEQTGTTDMSTKVLTAMASLERMDASVALFLLRCSHATGDLDLTNDLARHLGDRVRSVGKLRYYAESARLRFGPDRSLLELRNKLPRDRSANQAILLGEALLMAGLGEVSCRYLRRCHRRWPSVPRLRALYARACIASGYYGVARDVLNDAAVEQPTIGVGHVLAQLSFQNGAVMEAHCFARQQAKRDGRELREATLMWHLLFLENLEEADALLARMTANPTRGEYARRQFQAHWHSGLLMELRKYKAAKARCRAKTGPHWVDNSLVRENFFAAKYVIEHWVTTEAAEDRLLAEAVGASIPKRIFQHWNPDAIPAEVDAVMQSWRRAPGYSHQRLNREAARDFLRTKFDHDHVRAFDAAANYAEGSDFLRLCLIFAEGGIYTDVDNRLVGNLDTLLHRSHGMVLFHEQPFDPVANHAFCGVAGHRLLDIARGIALSSLLDDEDTNTWFKTGPGLLSRATAAYILETPEVEARRDLTILPFQHVRRHMSRHIRLSYKSTAEYWHGTQTAVPAEIFEALR